MLTPGPNRIGGTLRLNATFQDADGVLFDPDVLTVKLYNPQGTITTYTYGTDTEVVKSSTGLYYIDHAPTTAGRWHIRWTATEDTAVLILEDDYIVQTSPFEDCDFRGDYA